MIRNDEGLTKTYNRFHDPYEDDSGIVRLRELHDRHGRCRPRRLRVDRYPHRLRLPPRLRDRRSQPGIARRSRTAIAGQTPSAMRCSPVSLPSTPNGPPRKPARARHPMRLEGKSSRSPHAHNTVECRQPTPISGSRNQDSSGLPPMNELPSGRESTARESDLGRCRNLLACGVSSTPGTEYP